MMLVRRNVAEQCRDAIEIIDDHVELAVVEEIANCQATANIGLGERCSLDGGR